MVRLNPGKTGQRFDQLRAILLLASSTMEIDSPTVASPSYAMEEASLPAEVLELAYALLAAAKSSPLPVIKAILDRGAPAWFQDTELGWSALHYAAERREPAILRALLVRGAVWNAVDKWGQTAGEICLSLGDKQGWEAIRNEGVRTEMLHHALAGSGNDGDGVMTLRAEDKTSAGDNLEFLRSELTWDVGEDGRERVLDADGNG